MTSIIVAYTKSGRVIGAGNGLPWPRLDGDLPRFRRLTAGSAVVMGRRTWESLPPNRDGTRFLRDRVNVVVSRDAERLASYHEREGRPLAFVGCLERAFYYAHSMSPRVYIIGGEQVYREALRIDLVDQVIASEVHAEYPGDAFFPALGPGWEAAEREACTGYDLIYYRLKSGGAAV